MNSCNSWFLYHLRKLKFIIVHCPSLLLLRQLTVGSPAAQVVGQEKASCVHFWYGIKSCGGKVGFAVGSKVVPDAAELASCLPYGKETAAFSFQQESEGCEGVEEETQEKYAAQAGGWQVLVEEEEVVAEVEKRLAGI